MSSPRAGRAMPKLRDWMSTSSWQVNIIVCVIFVVLILQPHARSSLRIS